ncbi:MAG: hypothetical protein APF80_11010 [Alphaproteobacteria bacterium BRH_c36]|nr:MAG: hypothetical protein APF80_11010 [Alphaproteobacteria bacterium BRH_c36]
MTIFKREQFVAARGIFTTCPSSGRTLAFAPSLEMQTVCHAGKGDDRRWFMRPQHFNVAETSMKENSPFEVVA